VEVKKKGGGKKVKLIGKRENYATKVNIEQWRGRVNSKEKRLKRIEHRGRRESTIKGGGNTRTWLKGELGKKGTDIQRREVKKIPPCLDKKLRRGITKGRPAYKGREDLEKEGHRHQKIDDLLGISAGGNYNSGATEKGGKQCG